MSASLDATRTQLRTYLVPADPDSVDYEHGSGDHFPRSKVMRFAFNPRNRRLLMISGSVLAVLAARVVGADRWSLATDLARSFARDKN